MSTFEYIDGRTAFYNDRDHATTGGIRGLKGVWAHWVDRTESGNSVTPEQSWEARQYLPKMKEITRVEKATGDVVARSFEVFYADGTSEVIDPTDLLCVERPVVGLSAEAK